MSARQLAGWWSPLTVHEEVGGLRHYLDGEPIHCGEVLELQRMEFVTAEDGNERTAPLQEAIAVRYEARIDAQIRATLHHVVGGHEFVAGLEGWMRFRWPKVSR